MAWKATIKSVLENPTPNNTRDVIVEYTDGARTINRTYNVHADSFGTVDVAISFIKEQIDKLNKFDRTVLDLEALVDTEIS